MLRSFQDLVRVLTLHPSKYEAIYFPRKTVADDYDKLFDAMRTGNPKSEEDLAHTLYESRDKKALTRYFTLKSRLKDRIENGFFFLSLERFSHRNARRYAAWKEQLITWVLWHSGAKETAVQRLEKLAEEAESLGWNDVSVQAYRTLRSYHASQGSMVLLRKFDALLEQALERYCGEIKAESVIAEIDVFKARETLLTKEHIERCRNAQASIKQETKRLSANTLNQDSLYNLKVLEVKAAQYLAEAEDFSAKILTVLDQGSDILSGFPSGMEREEQAAWAWQLLPYSLIVKDFPRAKQAAERLLEHILPEMPEILTVYEYYFLTAMHTKHFAEAAQVFERAMQTQAMKSFAEDMAEKWQVFELTLRLVLRAEMPHRPTHFKPRFSVNKFLADIPSFSEDQISLNTSWILVQMLFLIDDGDWETAARKNNDLLVYHDKYLRKDTPSYRLQCFLRMMNYAALCNFEMSEILSKTHKYYLWLAEARRFDMTKTGYIEVLPFEDLWSLLLHRRQHLHDKQQQETKYLLEHNAKPLEYYTE